MSLVGSFKAAALDLYRGVLLTPLWWRVSVEQTVTRYRRSLLGPVWMASTTLATAFSLAIVFGSIFGGDAKDNLSFIMIGVVGWSITGGILPEIANTFVNAAGVMQVRSLPLSFHAFQQMSKIFINFMHQVVGLWLVLMLMKLAVVPHWTLLVNLPIALLTGLFVSIPLGMVSVRFRDINYMVGFIAQSLFMLTPVFWRRSQVPETMRWIVDLNPFSHLLEIVRQPLMGAAAPIHDVNASLAFLGVAALLTLISLTLVRTRVVFWL
ncbi:MAG: hypothetical protein B7Z44_12540 [Caulobacter sp. 12-67-6]|nr:MAG: hypothetical protein B7Z44_12540 [Caulobacter sp. 12-67-6]OYX71582.1 MAG: hypothetical protein B7Y81_08940 [Caulobacter sp. 32-67-35]OYX97482.1 MAG: hypothetical protein B7Y78_01950 [Caulobacter sp. 35-67-4]